MSRRLPTRYQMTWLAWLATVLTAFAFLPS